MVKFVVQHAEANTLPFDIEGARVIDLGTGNGHLLFSLHEELEEAGIASVHYHGIDYSPELVEFASKIAAKHSYTNFAFDQVDLLVKNSSFLAENRQKYQLLLDKGTLDAIALNNEPLAEFDGRIGLHVYASQVSQLMAPNGVLLITSCNFTEEELIRIITENNSNNLTVWNKINYKTFQFGGVQGSTICSVAFINKA